MIEVLRVGALKGHTSSIYALCAGFDKGTILSAAGDGMIVEWHPTHSPDGKLLAQVDEQTFCLAVSRTGGFILAGTLSGALFYIPLSGGEPRKFIFHKKSLYTISIYEDYFLTAGGDGVIGKWNYDLEPYESVRLNTSGIRTIASNGRDQMVVGARDGQIYFLDSNMQMQRSVKAHEGAVFSLVLSGHKLISGGLDAHLRIWSLPAEGQVTLEREIQAHYFTVNDIKYIGDTNIFATASRDKTVRLWSYPDWNLLKVLDRPKYDAHIGSVNGLFYLAEGNILCSASDDRSILLWKILTTDDSD